MMATNTKKTKLSPLVESSAATPAVEDVATKGVVYETRRVDYPIKSKGYRKKSTFPVECE
ncbi:hypothetical protein NSQ51_11180 [Geobacillus sp. FSL K6-0789]|uniref:Uncharacterized protein n=1 Tax=Geobacillus stearothermophilus TaxID=1422 RepID=A0A3L7CTW4_GEOSE|nr:hypothetical protein [Geobacillus stearothermophilus]RLQ07749.1 hypothetical protein D9549_09530 [Geobacillus stearothermophilus]RLQ09790.1 hypothetical protein D9547_08820 [Geobacillus stearothermophilus]RLQ13746.1 hypothetical protein D9548_09925 [Geobacillus stearothermophilus]